MITRAWMYLLGCLLFVFCALQLCGVVQELGKDFVPEATQREPARKIDLTQLPGTYYHGQICLTLNSDRTYQAELHACMGCEKSVGKWGVDGGTLVLSPTKESGTNRAFLGELQILERGQREVVFVDRRQRDFFHRYGVHPGTCFMRLDRRGADRKPTS